MRVWVALASPLLILVAVFAGFGAYLTGVRGLQGDDVRRAIEAIAFVPTSIAFGVSFLVTRAIARPDGVALVDAGWRRPELADVAVAVGAGIVLNVVNTLLLYPLVQQAQPGFDPALGILGLAPAMVMMGVAIVAEDTLFRGYAFEVLRARHGVGAAVLVTTAFYVPLAGAGGWPLMVWAGYFGIVLCGVKIIRGNLWTVAIAHWLVTMGPRLVASM